MGEGRFWWGRDPEERQNLFARNGHSLHRFMCFYIFVITVSETHGSLSTIFNWSRGRDGDFRNTPYSKKSCGHPASEER